jgi:signal transduction histidine kinase
LLSLIKKLDKMHGVAILTWFVVAASVLHIRAQQPLLEQVITTVLFFVFIFGWIFSTVVESRKSPAFFISLVVQWLTIVGLFYQVPMIYVAILGVLWSSILGYVLSIGQAMLITLIAIYGPFVLIHSMVWEHSGMLISAGLFCTFNIFAIVMLNTSLREREAKEQAQLLNNELIATQALLRQSATEQERTRIARNIHDLLGHHLTALSIKLQYASHTLDKQDTEKAKPAVDECSHIAKLLLSDVREAVSEMREQEDVDFRAMLETLCQSTPRLRITLDMADKICIDNVTTAQHVLSCIQESITNTLKHSTAKTMRINIFDDEPDIRIVIEDDGKTNKPIDEGNGLMGIRERIQMMQGKVAFRHSATGFVADIHLPRTAL